MGKIVAKVLNIIFGLEIAVGGGPVGDRVDDPVHELLEAALPIRPANRTVKVLAGHDIGRRLGPSSRRLHIALLEHRIALGIGDHGRPLLPLQDAVRRLAWP